MRFGLQEVRVLVIEPDDRMACPLRRPRGDDLLAVERKSVCIYSQLKTCSASEVAAMLEGLLRHDTSADIDRNYTDTHGASVVGFAFCTSSASAYCHASNASAPPACTGPACRPTPTGPSSDR